MVYGRNHVIWDGYAIGPGHSGIARHARLLCLELQRLGTRPLFLNPCFQINSQIASVIVRPGRSISMRSGHKIVRALTLNDDEAWLTEMFGRLGSDLPRNNGGSNKHNILHGLSNFNIPLSLTKRGTKRVLTVHDIIPILAKGQVSRALSLQMAYLMPKALAAADRIIAVSQWTADTLTEMFPWTIERLTVIPNGFNCTKDKDVKSSHVSRETFNEKAHFLLVSRFEAYKRFDHLVEIIKNSSKPITFTVITDDRGVRFLHRNARDHLEKGRLRVLSRLSDQQLDQYYRRADALLHLSQYEGFCLPAAEAISRGIPVIFQKGSGIDEVVGPCGVGMAPQARITDWVDLIESDDWRCKPPVLLDWTKKQIDWSTVAERTREVYNGL